jgi:hypothetical protein
MTYDAFSLLDNPTIDNDFTRKIQDLQLVAICNRPYIRVQKLKKWLRDRDTNAGYSHFQRILEKIHQDSNKYVDITSLLDEGKDAQEKSQRLDLVFSILMVLNRPKLLGQFQDVGIKDHALPISLQLLIELLTQLGLSDADELARKFDCLQWSFTPTVIEPKNVHLKKQSIVPIHRREILKKDKDGNPVSRGGTSQIFVVEVLEEFLSPALKEDIPNSCYSVKTDDLGPVSSHFLLINKVLIVFKRYMFVMKSLSRKFNADHKNEVENLRALRSGNAAGVILYLGSFRHPLWPAYEDNFTQSGAVNPPTPESRLEIPVSPADTDGGQDRSSCHIFFEYGDGDLLNLFECSPPSHPVEVQLFWQDLIRVADALAEIHYLPIPKQARQSVGVYVPLMS